MNLNIQILGSSSKGNCYVLRADEEILILECGIKFKEIQKALKFNFKNIVGCLVSHEHQDHSKSIRDFTRRSIDVYSHKNTFITLGFSSHRAKPVEALKEFNVGGFKILPFDVQHDAIAPLGFLIQHKSFGKLLFVTDTYYIKYKFKDLDYLMIECNHSTEIVKERFENKEIHYSVMKRLFNSHMSLENVKEFLRANDTSKLKEIYL
jgi:phosphoribosyl 1,2-cyclic phosphodiesterase